MSDEKQAPAFASPLGALRWKLRTEAGNMRLTSAREVRVAVAAVLDAPEWTQAAEEVNTLRTQLEHWKAFAIHAEGEHAAWKKAATELDAELRALRDPAPLVAWITEGGCECLQRGEGPVRVMPEEDHETGFTVPLYARERTAQKKDCRECATQPCDACPDAPDSIDPAITAAIAKARG